MERNGFVSTDGTERFRFTQVDFGEYFGTPRRHRPEPACDTSLAGGRSGRNHPECAGGSQLVPGRDPTEEVVADRAHVGERRAPGDAVALRDEGARSGV